MSLLCVHSGLGKLLYNLTIGQGKGPLWWWWLCWGMFYELQLQQEGFPFTLPLAACISAHGPQLGWVGMLPEVSMQLKATGCAGACANAGCSPSAPK